MNCSACDFENPPENRFCMGCGAPLARTCAGCGAPAPAVARFCGACGCALAAPEAGAAERPRPEVSAPLATASRAGRARGDGERRQVTVLFCDLAESTAITEALGPEVYRELLDDYLERVSLCVQRYEGVINQLAGDGFMAIFGAPVAHDDDAARACRAGLDIQAELRLLSRAWQPRLSQRLAARVGINTGLAVVGSIGGDRRADYSAIGDTTNVASRIEAYAPPGEVLISASTRKLVAPLFETEEVASAALKGKRERVTVYRLIREVPRAERRHQALRAGLAPHLGRHTELALLRERFEEARGGSGQVLFIGGEAGIGKSRLVHEFRRQLEPGSHLWLEGQCVSYGSQVAHLPIADLLRGFFDVEESDSAVSVILKIQRRCLEVGGPVKDAEPFFRDLLAVDPGDERLARMNELIKAGHIFESLRDLIHALARAQPVVLLVDDVHWIDPSSEQLLRRLFETLAVARVFVLVTHRSEYTWRHPERSWFGRVQLRGLGTPQVAQLASAVVGRDVLPEPLARLIAERSDGNPFFVEEVTKSLAERGLLEGEPDLESLGKEVPSTVQEVLLARIDRLEEEAKRTLQVASVIGREFTVRVLERIAEQRQTGGQVLEELRGLEFIYEKATYPELAYMFKHALTHDVAYATLLEKQRRALHAATAALVEELYADRLPEFYEMLAFQWHGAERPERAAHYALLAAERAARHLAPEAEHAFRQAAEWASGAPDSRDVFVRAQLGLGDQLLRRGETDAANRAFAAALGAVDAEPARRAIRNKLVERRFCERDGVRLAYYVHGEGSDGDPARTVPLVFVHPLIQGSFSFQDLAQRLCQTHTVVFMDPRGIGASENPGDPWNFDQRVEDAMAVLRELPYERFVLFGDSDGVPMSLRLYEALPERVERLVLFGFAAVGLFVEEDNPFAPPQGTREQLERLLLRPDFRTALENFFRLLGDEPGMSAWLEVMIPHWEESLAEADFKAFLHEALLVDMRPSLPRVRVPTLVMAAERDAIPVKTVRYLADHIAGARYALIEGASHFAPFTATEVFVEILEAFLSSGNLPRERWSP